MVNMLLNRRNTLGLCEIATDQHADLLVFPGYTTGSVQLVDLSQTEANVSQSPILIDAHRTAIRRLAVNRKGTLIASASEKGTLIRIWDAKSRQKLLEVRRGSDTAIVNSMSFSRRDDWLCCASDKGTVHVFAISDLTLNKQSLLAMVNMPGAYAQSNWSCASFTVPQECACVCAFADMNSEGQVVFAACFDGSYHRYFFTKERNCNQIQYDLFTEMCEDCLWSDLRK